MMGEENLSDPNAQREALLMRMRVTAQRIMDRISRLLQKYAPRDREQQFADW